MKLSPDHLLWIDAVEPPAALAAALADAGLTVHVLGVACALATWHEATRGEGTVPAVVVLGASVDQRLTLARALHQAAPAVHLVFLGDLDDVDALRHAMARAPMIGVHWTVAAGPPAVVAAEVRSVAEATRQRLTFRAALDRINEQRRTASDPDEVPRGRVVTIHYLASILEHAEDAILAIERDDTIATWNVGAVRLFASEPRDALGQGVASLVEPGDADLLVALVRAARDGTSARHHELTCRRSDGTTFRGALTVAPVRDEEDRIQAVSLMVRDVTERRRQEAEIKALNAELSQRLRDVHRANAELAATLATLERTQRDLVGVNRTLERQATTDALTGLKNRIVFQNSLLEMIHVAERHGTPLSLLLVDVDHFKRVNDTLGHLEGDRALQAVALALTAHVREQDIVARFGGEEFAVLLPSTGLEDALRVAEHLRIGCAGAYDRVPTLTVSVGVASFAPGESEASLVRRADVALYASKAQGRNRVTAAAPGARQAGMLATEPT